MPTTTTTAPGAVSFADFKTWLKSQIASTSDAVSVTRGPAQGAHVDRLLMLLEADKVAYQFEREGGKP